LTAAIAARVSTNNLIIEVVLKTNIFEFFSCFLDRYLHGVSLQLMIGIEIRFIYTKGRSDANTTVRLFH